MSWWEIVATVAVYLWALSWVLFILTTCVVAFIVLFQPLFGVIFRPSKADRAQAEADLWTEIRAVGYDQRRMAWREQQRMPYLDRSGQFHW